ncbi:unnamed protein product, partial [Darwinula stevensoni]
MQRCIAFLSLPFFLFALGTSGETRLLVPIQVTFYPAPASTSKVPAFRLWTIRVQARATKFSRLSMMPFGPIGNSDLLKYYAECIKIRLASNRRLRRHESHYKRHIAQYDTRNTLTSSLDGFWNLLGRITTRVDFTLFGNKAVEEFPPGVFGNVSFERTILLHTQVGSIHRSALRSSKEQLRRPEILAGELREFPWDILPDMPGLVHLDLGENFLLDLPPVESPSLERLSLGGNKIARLTVGWSTPNLTALVVGFMAETRIELWGNEIRNFTKESFVLMLENLAAGEGYIDLY